MNLAQDKLRWNRRLTGLNGTFPGGGGYGPVDQRDPDALSSDVRSEMACRKLTQS